MSSPSSVMWPLWFCHVLTNLCHVIFMVRSRNVHVISELWPCDYHEVLWLVGCRFLWPHLPHTLATIYYEMCENSRWKNCSLVFSHTPFLVVSVCINNYTLKWKSGENQRTCLGAFIMWVTLGGCRRGEAQLQTTVKCSCLQRPESVPLKPNRLDNELIQDLLNQLQALPSFVTSRSSCDECSQASPTSMYYCQLKSRNEKG